MSTEQLSQNLKLFLDPTLRYREDLWEFRDGAHGGALEAGRNVVLHFSRRQLPHYYLLSWKIWRAGRVRSRRLLHMNDGLLSSVFDSVNAAAYGAFARNHLPQRKGLRQRLTGLLPLSWRAEGVYLVVIGAGGGEGDGSAAAAAMAENDFMFFSNAAGKLLLLPTQALLTGRGALVKTSAVAEYAPCMAREFETVADLAARMGEENSLPKLGRRVSIGGRHFFFEEYLPGETLREHLRRIGRRDAAPVCGILDSLDRWFARYIASFPPRATDLSSLYTGLFALFSECYGAEGGHLLETARRLLDSLHLAVPTITPIVAHNDLWPGNIVMKEGGGFVVIDWERAMPERAPFFDYFWMVVSTSIEALATACGNDYAEGTRELLRFDDEISCHALRKLTAFLTSLGIAHDYLHHLLFLFFLEWSVQGYQVLGKRTAMDRLAFRQLLHYDEMTGGATAFSLPRAWGEEKR